MYLTLEFVDNVLEALSLALEHRQNLVFPTL